MSMLFDAKQTVDRSYALKVLGVTGGAGLVLSAGSVLFNRAEGESAGRTAQRMLVEGGRGAALGLAGGLGALSYKWLAKPVEHAFSSETRLGKFGSAAVGATVQGGLVGAAIGGYRALVPQSARWAAQPLRDRVRTFVPADTKSWANTGFIMGLVGFVFNLPGRH